MATRKQLLDRIADLKERRNKAILDVAPPDDVAAGQDDPTVREIAAEIKALRDELAARDKEE